MDDLLYSELSDWHEKNYEKLPIKCLDRKTEGNPWSWFDW